MRLVGQYGNKKLYILVDPGSSHNFLDIKVATELGCPLEDAPTYRVNAAFGNQMTSAHKCSSFTWKVQGYSFTTEIRTLPLDCCDLVLGVQWLVTLGPILWDFSNLRMEFSLRGIKHVLRGVAKHNFKIIKGSRLNKVLLAEPQIALLQIQEVSQTSTTQQDETRFPSLLHISTPDHKQPDDPLLQNLLETYADLFEIPTHLPPFRNGFDHQIPLIEGSQPINKRPYRYSSLQKDIIDKIIADMLRDGTIQYSSSPYASPVVLVKKKDGSWRLCVDYRGLNQ